METVFFLGLPEPMVTETVALHVPLPTIVRPLPFDLQTFEDFAGTEIETSPPTGRLTFPVDATSVADHVAPITGCGVTAADFDETASGFGNVPKSGGNVGFSNFGSFAVTTCNPAPPDELVVVVTTVVLVGAKVVAITGAAVVVVGFGPTEICRAVVDGAIVVVTCGSVVVVTTVVVVDVVVEVVGGTPTVTVKFVKLSKPASAELMSLSAATRNSSVLPVVKSVMLAAVESDFPSLMVAQSVEPAARMSTR